MANIENESLSTSILYQHREIASAILELENEICLDSPLFGYRNEDSHLQNIIELLLCLANSLSAKNPSLFFEYVNWKRISNKDLCYSIDITLKCLGKTLKDHLPKDFLDLINQQLKGSLPVPGKDEPSGYISSGNPLEDLANKYLGALLYGEKQLAADIIHGAIDDGIHVRDIYLHVFQPSLYEVGRLWQLNKVSVAQEHYSTAVTQFIMSQLYPHILSQKRTPYKFVGVCASGELHEIGLRMVSDFLEMEGWQTFYVGANVPAESIAGLIRDKKAHVLGISATLTYHVPIVARLIKQLRLQEDFQELKIIVGGNPFNWDQDLWQQVGADAFARDAAEAVKTSLQLVSRGGIS